MKGNRKKALYCVIFLCYVAVLLRITVFRSTLRLADFGQNGTVNMTLLVNYLPLIRQGQWGRFFYLFAGNIIWFVPFGMYLEYTGRIKGVLRVALWGFLLSLLIETLQYVLGTGYSELDDLLLNTLGAWAGAVLMRWLRPRIQA